jgi:two-component system, sensor histidine kinase PdtaS
MDVQNLRERPPSSDPLAEFKSQPFVDIDHGGALTQAIVDTVREPLLILDKDLRVVSASHSFYLTFGMTPRDVEGQKVYALGNGQWNIPELRLLLENISPRHAMMEAYEVEQDFSGIGLRTLLLNARKVFNEKTFRTTILLAIEDITERRAMKREHEPYAIMAARLEASRAREEVLRQETRELAQRQAMLAQEFEHRLVNGLQLISSLLSVQSRTATTPEASAQLTTAASRVAALGRVHHRLHLLDHLDRVEFKQYLTHLCEDLSRLLCEDTADCAIVVEGASGEIATATAIPLGFIVNELVTNAVKYAKGNITVRFETSGAGHTLSVGDAGPGLPTGFEPARSKGLGMKIVLSQVKQIRGALNIQHGDNGLGTRFAVTFSSCAPQSNGAPRTAAFSAPGRTLAGG